MFHKAKPSSSKVDNETKSSENKESTQTPSETKKVTENAANKTQNPQSNMIFDNTTSATDRAPNPGKETAAMTEQDKTKDIKKEDTSSDTKTDSTMSSSPFNKPSDMGQSRTTPSYGTYSPTAYASGTASTPTTSTQTASGRRLVVGEGISISGEIESCDNIVVEGTVEAALKGAKVLEISSTGSFYGTVEIEQATIAGRFEGDITVSGRLVLKSTSSVTGKIQYGELAMEAGASLDGTLVPLKTNAAAAQNAPAKKEAV